ncbi:MAG: glycerol-3-phosphate dehydrogenase/oxidase [Planctomycetia bacterium]
MPDRAARDMTVVVLGAGINGAALARELLLSGLGVVLVDSGDIACGATAWSTRLVHGGLRYLEYGEIGLVRESLAERDRLVRLAPHLVRPLEFYLPMRTRWGGLASAAARLLGLESLAKARRSPGGRGSIAVGMGLTLYDSLAVGPRWPRHRAVRPGAAGLPAVDARAFPHAAVYADAQMLFPERFTVELCVDARRIASAQGTQFALVTHASFERRADGSLRIGSAGRAADGVRDVRPAAVINATGAWVDRTRAELLPHDGRRLIGGTKGSHLVLDAHALRAALGDCGVYAEADDGRPVFVLPFGPQLVLVGTTDIPFRGDPATARADDDEIAYLLAAVARLFPAVAPGRSAVVQHYCGVRPLPAADEALPASVTRRHMLVRHAEAPVPTWSIVGGKLTTCRSLAEQAAREVLGTLGLPVLGSSRERPLPGSITAEARGACVAEASAAIRAAGVAAERGDRAAECTVGLFGSRAPDLCRTMVRLPSEVPPLVAGTDLPTAAVGFCTREEWAASLDDLVERRLMLSFAARLSHMTLTALAVELVRLGMLPADRVEAEVRRCAEVLHERYGKNLA